MQQTVSQSAHTPDTEAVLHRDMVRNYVRSAGAHGVTASELTSALNISRSSAGTRLVELSREGSVRATSRGRLGETVYMRHEPTTFHIVNNAPAVVVARQLRAEIQRALNNIDEGPSVAKRILVDALAIGREMVE